MTAGGSPARRSVFVAEVVALLATTVVDSVLAVRSPAPRGALGPLLELVVPYVGSAVAVLAVLRRRFPRRIELLGVAVVGFSLFSTVGGALTDRLPPRPVVTEVLAVLLLAAAGCRRSSPVRAAVLAVVAGAAVVLAPAVRYGLDYPAALFPLAAALAWGAALALGLILRDADDRHRRELERARTEDRLQLARDLHDLVAHHVTGIVVRTRAAQALAGNPAVPEQDHLEFYDEVERAAAEALTATRGLVGLLRSDDPMPAPSAVLGDVVRTAVNSAASVRVSDDVERLLLPPQVATALHRVLMEALTNVRRHARATDVRVVAGIEDGKLVLVVDNDGVPDDGGDGHGYGITGMAERVTALGGELTAGPRDGGLWRVTASVPLGPDDDPFDRLPRGI
ncbi:sensor histidine kinase [Umezawaea beigongshangensis]|uniref:sensor histidine kinase n=1 Tax=Umezawaea beigongshangensis TaxID=2780383 RepID=UPI0018F1993C|nr:histidine kinase [Umezawaea beigongshangensis]